MVAGGSVEVEVGSGRRFWRFRVSVRDPRVELAVKPLAFSPGKSGDSGDSLYQALFLGVTREGEDSGLSAPADEGVFPGETVDVPVRVSYVEGDPDSVMVELTVDGEKTGVYSISRGGSVTVKIGLGPGRHVVRARDSLSGAVATGEVVVPRRRPVVRVAGFEGSVRYPEGGRVAVVLEVAPPTSRIVGVRVSESRGGRVRVEGVGGDGRVSLSVEEPGVEVAASLVVVVESVDGVRDEIRVEARLPVELSGEFEAEWKSRVESLIKGYEEEPVVDWLGRAGRVLEECRRTVGRLGFDCSGLGQVVEAAKGEVEALESALKRIAELAGKEEYVDAANTALELLGECGKPRYKGVKACGELAGRIVDLLESAASWIEGLYNESKLDEVIIASEPLLKLCSEGVPGTGRSCGVIERVKRVSDTITRIINELIELRVPERHASRILRGTISVSYSEGSDTITGVKIDFTPATGYIRVDPKPVVELPRLLPGSDFTVEVVMESLVKGRVPIPYKVCYRDYCVEKVVYTVVGVPHRAPIVKRSIEDYIGKSVHGLRRLAPEPVRPKRLTRPVRVGRYTCTGLLGEGGIAIALLCNDEAGVNTVIKLPLEAIHYIYGEEYGTMSVSTMKSHIEAFDKEARILSRLNHPNIIRVHGHGVKPIPYIAFEFCEYGDLHRLVGRTRPLDVKLALEVMIQVGAALAYGHEQKVLHLDVKPSNILVTKELIPKLSDYNIAKAMITVSQMSRQWIESHGAFTPGFGAPEQVNPSLPKPGPYSDIFSHAATLYYIITGAHPYPLEEWSTGLFRESPKPIPPSNRNPQVPRDLDLILVEALSPHPHERPQKMREYVEQLVEVYERI